MTFPDFSLTLIANYKIPWLATKFPDFSLTLRKTGISLTFPWPWQPWKWLGACQHHDLNRCLFIVNTLRSRQNGRHFAQDTFKRIFLEENVRISIKISLNVVPKSPIHNIPALFLIMAWRRPGDKPLSEAMVVSLLTHMCVARPQWVNWNPL